MNIKAINRCRLFRNMDDRDIAAVCGCLGAVHLRAVGGAAISDADSIAVVTKGYAAPYGERIARPGDVFLFSAGSAAAVVPGSELMLFSVSRICAICPACCRPHRKLIENAVGFLCERQCAADMRHRLCCALLMYSGRAGSFRIPVTRDELAACLQCSKGDLTRELRRLREENLIFYSNRDFTLCDRLALAALTGESGGKCAPSGI